MIKVSPENIAVIKKATGAGTITCKSALIEANGNVQIAISILKKRDRARIQSENNSEPKLIVKKEPKFAYKNEELVEHYKQISQILPKRKSTSKINYSFSPMHLKCNECEEDFELEFEIHHYIKNKRHIHCVYCGCQNTTETFKDYIKLDSYRPDNTSFGDKVKASLIALIIVVVIFFLFVRGMIFILELFA